jgi:hypothetical protein
MWTAVNRAIAACNTRYLPKKVVEPKTQEAMRMNFNNVIRVFERLRKR